MANGHNQFNGAKWAKVLAHDIVDPKSAAGEKDAASGGYPVRIATTLDKAGASGRLADGTLAKPEAVEAICKALQETLDSKGRATWLARVRAIAYFDKAEIVDMRDKLQKAAQAGEYGFTVTSLMTAITKAKGAGCDPSKGVAAVSEDASTKAAEKKAEKARKQEEAATRKEMLPCEVAALEIFQLSDDVAGMSFKDVKADPRIREAREAAAKAIAEFGKAVHEYGEMPKDAAKSAADKGAQSAADTIKALTARFGVKPRKL